LKNIFCFPTPWRHQPGNFSNVNYAGFTKCQKNLSNKSFFLSFWMKMNEEEKYFCCQRWININQKLFQIHWKVYKKWLIFNGLQNLMNSVSFITSNGTAHFEKWRHVTHHYNGNELNSLIPTLRITGSQHNDTQHKHSVTLFWEPRFIMSSVVDIWKMLAIAGMSRKTLTQRHLVVKNLSILNLTYFVKVQTYI